MIDRQEGLVFIPTKRDKNFVVSLGKSQEVKILDDHSVSLVRFKKTRGRRRILDVSWHFYEEINDENHPWHNKVRYHPDKQTSEKRRLFSQIQRASSG